MGFISDIVGTLSSVFQLGKTGPKLKNSAGVVEHRNNADSAYAITRGADPAGVDDLVTKRFGDANYGGTSSLLQSHVVGTNVTISAGTSATVSRYIEIAAGVTLEIGADADLEIG